MPTDTTTLEKAHGAVLAELKRRGLEHASTDLLDLAEGQALDTEVLGFRIRVARSRAPVERSAASDLLGFDRLRQIVYGVVLEPGAEDFDGLEMSATEIEKTAHRFLPGTRQVWVKHGGLVHQANVVESYLAPSDLEFDDPAQGRQWVPKGTWIVGIHVEDPEVWGKIERGELVGLSPRLLTGVARSQLEAQASEKPPQPLAFAPIEEKKRPKALTFGPA
jgi:hypothetical protein